MTAEYAADIATWRYPAPYDCYDMTGADPDFLVDPAGGFHALVDNGGSLIGFRSFGPDGRVPGGVYDAAACGRSSPDAAWAGRPSAPGWRSAPGGSRRRPSG
jgi:hypothetical protein